MDSSVPEWIAASSNGFSGPLLSLWVLYEMRRLLQICSGRQNDCVGRQNNLRVVAEVGGLSPQ